MARITGLAHITVISRVRMGADSCGETVYLLYLLLQSIDSFNGMIYLVLW